jgi:hypothetical protein
MRMFGVFGAALALSALTSIGPAHAYLAPWQLMETDLFQWPDWHEILGKYDCTTELEFYLWNAPSPPAPVIITPPAVFDPVVIGPSKGEADPPDPTGRPSGHAPGGSLTGPVDPPRTPWSPGMPGGDTPGAAAAVPEPSTWAMVLLGFAGLGYAAIRRSKARISDLA